MDLLQDFKKLKTSLSLNLQTMGVINITPDSFSDGNELVSYESFKSKFLLQAAKFDCVDIGAESTAPFNSAIDSFDELKRFQDKLYPLVEDIADPQVTLSIDTYKPEVFYEIALYLKANWPKTKLIFNDISGKIDEDLLLLFKEPLEFDYIYSHNLAPNRSLSSQHMDYLCSDERFLDRFENFFYEGKKLLKYNRQIWADPCFGFSKTRTQNHKLLQTLSRLNCFDSYEGIVCGLSRKSFLRYPQSLDPSKTEDLEILEQVHSSLLFELLKNRKKILIRSHKLEPIYSAVVARGLMRGVQL